MRALGFTNTAAFVPTHATALRTFRIAVAPAEYALNEHGRSGFSMCDEDRGRLLVNRFIRVCGSPAARRPATEDRKGKNRRVH
jgi:hypothetical protein